MCKSITKINDERSQWASMMKLAKVGFKIWYSFHTKTYNKYSNGIWEH
jgi:hypothetical protein